LREALNSAREQGLDLVEVAPGASPPVCKILDYGKHQYLQMKKQREARKGQKVVEIKEVRLRPKTGDYHIAFKMKRARRFLAEGMKVKVRIQFRGREITYPEIAMQQLKDVAAELADVAEVEQRPNMDGRSMLMVMAPKKGIAEAAEEPKASNTGKAKATGDGAAGRGTNAPKAAKVPKVAKIATEAEEPTNATDATDATESGEGVDAVEVTEVADAAEVAEAVQTSETSEANEG